MHLRKLMSKTIYQMIRMVRDMTVDDTSVGTIIDMEAMEEEDDSLGIATIYHINPSSALHVIKRDIGMPTVHIKTELTSNFVLIVE